MIDERQIGLCADLAHDITIMRASLKGFALKFLSERRLRAMGKMEIEVIIRRAGEVILDILARL